jgi:hypothetical protein
MSDTDKSELKQEGYPDEIAAEVWKAKRRATTMFHNNHDDGDTAIYQLLAELAPLITQHCNQAKASGYIEGGMLELGNFINDAMYTGRKTVEIEKLVKAYDELSELQAQAEETEKEL